MAEAVPLLVEVISKFVGCLWNPVKNQVNYLCCYSSNVRRLDVEVVALERKKQSLEQDVTAAKNNLETIRPEVELWLQEAEEVLTKRDTIVDDEAKVHERCLSKWCPVLHYTLSKEAKKTTEKSIQLRTTSSFERISNPPEDIPPISPPTIELSSRDSIENQIMDALKDESVYLIGLYGMGGVGKTTIAKKVMNRVHEERKAPGSTFKHVVLAVVSQKPDIPMIQQEIAKVLGLKLDDKESKETRARRLHQRLKNEINGVLIILDDVWEKLNLEEDLGIPLETKCKLLLTSRNEDALKLAGDPKIIQLDVLNDEESWILFRNNAGDQVDSPDLHQIAKGVVGECKGLPLALVTVGLALRYKNKSYWEGALQELRKSIPSNISNVLKGVYSPLLWSINRLESKEARYLFLLCCLFPEDSIISIDALIRYGMGLKIFRQIETLREARSQVELIVRNLISSSLLIDASDRWGNLNVKMHDVIRDVGIYLASDSKEEIESENKIVSMEKHVFKISHGMEKWPTEDTYGNHTCISLTFSPRESIFSDCINCPSLELLHIGCKTVLPENFFNGMSGLKVLEASRIGSLPSSIQVLKNLRTLHLFDCMLETISVIGLGELMDLEILSFEDCQIPVLPKEIGGLKKLRKLDITRCRGLGTVAFGVVSGLVRLEELVMMGSFRDWEAEGNDDEMINNASLVELDSLNHLTTLQIEVSSSNAIPRRIPHWVQRLEKYYIRITSSSSLGYKSLHLKFQKILILNVQEEETCFGDWFYRMAKDADYLDLNGSNCTYVVNNLNRTGYQNLKHFELYSFTNIQYLCEGQYTGAVFPVLKHLFIEDSDSLQMIINGSVPTRTFEALEEIKLDGLPSLVCIWACPSETLCLSNLKIVNIYGCRSLLYLFPLSTMERLSQLRALGVNDCPIMKEIFRKEEGGMGIKIKKMEFPKLESLRLSSLGSLYEFCKAVEEIDVPALHWLSIGNLTGKANHNIHQQYFFDKLGEANNSLQLRIMFSPLTNFNFGTNLQELTIASIPNVKSVFAPSTLWFFPSLRDLCISDCPELEEVIGKGQENVQQTKSQIFPRLETVLLYSLPNILTFCSNMGHLELLSLTSLFIKNCPVMKTFDREIDGATESFFSEKVSCPKLSSVNLRNLDIERIFDQNLIDNFCRLDDLRVRSCPRIKHLFSNTNFRNLKSLKDLYLDNCEKLEEVIGKEDGEEAATTELNKTLSPQLKRLEFTGLPNMHTFYSINNHLELPSLEWVNIKDCPMLQRFSLGTLHLPRFIQTEGALEDTDFATKFFFNKEKSSSEIDFEENNCFTISARDLTTDNGGKLTSVLEKVSSDTFVALGKPHYSWSVGFSGKLDSIKLSTGVWYEVIFMIMLEDDARGWENSIELKLTLSGEIIEHHKEILDHKPRGEWIEILAGKFMRKDHHIGDLEFSLYQSNKNVYKSGLYVKGIKIQNI